jgi:hypothetical protein
MLDPTQCDLHRIRVVLDHGEVVELDGGTLVLNGEESPSVVLRLAPCVPGQWPAYCRSGRRCRGSSIIRLGRTWTSWICPGTLELAAAALGDHDEPIMRSPRGSRVIPNRQRCQREEVF